MSETLTNPEDLGRIGDLPEAHPPQVGRHAADWAGPLFGRRVLGRLTRTAIAHPLPILLAALALLAGSGWLAKGLPIRSSFEELLPSQMPSVRQVKELKARVGGDGTVLVNIQLQRDGSLSAAEALAEQLGRELAALGPGTVRAVEWNVRPVERYYDEHWPLLLSVDELEKARAQIDAAVHRLKRKANPFGLGLDEEKPRESAPESPWLDPKAPTPREQVSQRFARYTDGYLVHPDQRSVAVLVRPAGTSLSVEEADALDGRLKAIIDRHRAEISRAHLHVGLGGTFPVFVAEYQAIIRDVASTALLCIALVLASLVLFFRDARSTLSLGFAIVVAVTVAFGLTRLVIGYLNTQTAFLGSIVVGNGINYGLIYLARVRQLRRRGVGLTEACLDAAPTTAHATLLAALGSSVSFGMLLLAQNRGFRHFGFIGGVGMLLCWVFTFLLVPAALSLFERFKPVQPKAHERPGLVTPPRWLDRLFHRPGAIAWAFGALSLAALAVFLVGLPHIVERDLGKLGNQLNGPLATDNERANEALGRSTAGAVALLPSWAAADDYCSVVRERQKDPAYAQVVQGCETLSSVVPRDQDRRLALISDIAHRLTDARIALLKPEQRPRVEEIRRELLAQRPVSPGDAPGVLVDRFREKDGTLGKLALVTARPEARLEESENLQAFVRAVRRVPVDGQTHDATGENVIFADLLTNIQREGPITTLGSALGVFLLIAFFFRKPRASVELMGSLAVGVILMAGVATALGVKINFFNFIVFPITFGIAVDYGANVLMRVDERGGRVRAALAEVGPAVALCSWTSMIGYGSLLLASNQALRSFGRYAIIGELTSISAALLLLPALRMLWRPGARAERSSGETS